MGHRKTILIVGVGTELYRGYILRSVCASYDVAILSSDEAEWARPYTKEICYFDNGSTTNNVFAAVSKIASRLQIAGVLTCEERYVEMANAIAGELALPANTMETAFACRDKHLMRAAFARRRVPTAQSVLVRSVSEATSAAKQIGFPVVVKPRSLSGSIGVQYLSNAFELEQSLVGISDVIGEGVLQRKGVLIEEYLSGPEVSVESVVVDGKVEIAAITRKQLGFHPFFEELGHMVSPHEPVADAKRIGEAVHQAHRALNIQRGVTHAELRLTPSGPRMLEIALRLGGDRIPDLVHVATGINLAAAAADIAVGKMPNTIPTKSRAAGIRFIYPPYDCNVVAVPDKGLPEMDGVIEVSLSARPGQVYRLPPRGFLARLGLVIAEGETCDACAKTLDDAVADTEIVCQPADP